MRRIVGILALLGGLLVATAMPASAHPAIQDPYVPAHVTTTVAFGVPSEEPGALVEVDLTLPADFTLQRLDPAPGWSIASSAGQIRFLGGDVPQGGYVQFTFAGVFAAKRVIELPVVTRSSEGTVRNWVGGNWPPALVFPGYARGTAPVAGYSSVHSGRRTQLELGGGIIMGVAVVSAMVALFRRRFRTSVTHR